MRDWRYRLTAWSDVAPDVALDRLQAELASTHAEPVGPIDLKLSDQHAFGAGVVYLAEVPVLALRIPNPMPRISIWSRRRG